MCFLLHALCAALSDFRPRLDQLPGKLGGTYFFVCYMSKNAHGWTTAHTTIDTA